MKKLNGGKSMDESTKYGETMTATTAATNEEQASSRSNYQT
jgi:hypothetical protein